MKFTPVATAVTVTAALLGAGTPSAEAASTTCSGTVTGRTLSAVVVPAGRSCVLNGTTVNGSVTVNRGARLAATRAHVTGTVSIRPKATARFTGSVLHGQLTAFYADAVTLKSTSLTGDIRSTGRPGGMGYDGQMPNSVPVRLKIITGSHVSGTLDLHGTRLGISRSTVRGAITGGWNHIVTLMSTAVEGQIDLANFREGAITLCADTVAGDVSLRRGSYGAFLGQTSRNTSSCRGNSFKGALSVNDMLGVRMRGNTVSGLASGVNPAWAGATGVMGSDNTFRGGVQGDFTLAALRK